MDPIHIVLLQNALAASFVILSRKIALRLHHAHFQFVAIVLFVVFMIGLVWAALHGGPQLSALWEWLPRIIFGGLCFSATMALSFRVYKYVDAATAALMSTLNILAVIALSTLFIGEGLSPRTGLGALLVIGAAWLVLSARTSTEQRRAWMIALGLSLAAALVYGLAMVNEKFLLNSMGMTSYVVWGWGAQCAAAFVLSLLISRRGYREIAAKKPYGLLAIAGLTMAGSGLCFIIALVLLDNLSVMSGMSGLKVVLAAIFGLLILRERQFILRKLGASLLAAFGVAIMFS